MRGTARFYKSCLDSLGITPAHAGNRVPERTHGAAAGDHPRTCGEQQVCNDLPADVVGSPPHMRGTAPSFRVIYAAFGITPAHAGNRYQKHHRQPSLQDHPRTCGEQTAFSDGWASNAGSPPHMRGTVQPLRFYQLVRRITPAHAGNSDPGVPISVPFGDHPRTCGEQPLHSSYQTTGLGSPPHMRGTVRDLLNSTEDRRITPAHAGNRTWRTVRS